jgi:hypothetical protein
MKHLFFLLILILSTIIILSSCTTTRIAVGQTNIIQADAISFSDFQNRIQDNYVDIVMRDSTAYEGTIVQIDFDSTRFLCPNDTVIQVIPTIHIYQIVQTEHLYGALSGAVTYFFLGTIGGGLLALINDSNNDMSGLGYLLSGMLYGSALGLIGGGINGFRTVYQFPDHPEALLEIKTVIP